jgi:hypothetical protein
VVGVREAVLVQPEPPARRRVPLAQPRRLLLVEVPRDDGDVQRQPVRVEAVEQLAQPVGAPPGVVVAEVERDGRGRGVERRGEGIEPAGYARIMPPATVSFVASSMRTNAPVARLRA